jgi:hypothetical protein
VSAAIPQEQPAPARNPLKPGSHAPTEPDADACLSAAEQMLAEVVSGARGAWPHACAWLIRLALEASLTRFWESACPPVAHCRSHRAQFLLLPQYLDPAVARRAYQAWAVLSRAGHHHSYELGLTSAELSALHDEVAAIMAVLRDTGSAERA